MRVVRGDGPLMAALAAHRLLHRNGRAQGLWGASDEESHLELKIEQPAWDMLRALCRIGLVELNLAFWPDDGRAAGTWNGEVQSKL